MKRLIVTIIVAILAISLSGCSFVREHYRGHASHEVVVTSPRHLPVRHERWRHPYARHHMTRRDHPGFRRMHR
jgi:uncharacterized protein YceK